MESNAQSDQGVLAGPAIQSSTAEVMGPLFDDADAVRRSESNVLQWMQYLPADCINKMIEMGWDVTT